MQDHDMRFVSMMILLLTAASLRAGDWPQWRGPNRDGVAPESPELAEVWPIDGPPKVWQSDPLSGGGAAGYGSPVVAAGRVYVFSSARLRVPIATRTFTGKQFSAFAADRLRQGTNAFDFAVLDKVAEIKDREFETQELFDKWLADSGIPADMKTEVVRRVPTTEDQAQDIITCLSATDGKLVWKKEYPVVRQRGGHGSSSTPCVAGGRVYALGANAVYCLGAEKGEEIWQVKAGARGKNCSPMVLDGLVIAPIGPLTAFDAATGEVKWAQKQVAYTHSSPVAWENGGRKFAVCNTGGNVVCVDAQTGEIAWEAPGGGNSTAVVRGNTMLILSGSTNVGLTAYTLSPEKAEKSWTIDGLSESGSSPLIHEAHAYAIKTSFGAICVELDTGKEIWRAKPGTEEWSSPILADGNKILTAGREGIKLIRLDPTGCTVIAMADLGKLGVTSPAFFDGKLVVRGSDAVHCYDLTRQSVTKLLPRYTVSRASRPPKIDGVLDDAAWKTSAGITNFHLPAAFRPNNLPKEKPQPPGPPTVARLTWDERGLYVAIRCEEPKPDALRLKAQQRDDSVSEDDSVEFFIDADADRQAYHQIIVNGAGIVYDACGFDKSWNGPFEVAAGREPGAWTVELAFPWATLGVAAPKAGANIRFLMVRNRYASGSHELTMWPALHGHTTHQPMLFADGLLGVPDKHLETERGD